MEKCLGKCKGGFTILQHYINTKIGFGSILVESMRQKVKSPTLLIKN